MRPLTITSIVALAGCLAAGCATHPLGEDWGKLDSQARDERVRGALKALVTGGVSGDGDAFEDREVLSCTLDEVTYRPSDGVGVVSSLRWVDVRSVTGQTQTTLPSRPETLFLYLADDSPSTKSVRDLTQPVLSKVGLVSTYLLLRNRPRRSRAILIHCLDYLRRRRLNALAAAAKKGKAKKGEGKEPKTEPQPKPQPKTDPQPKTQPRPKPKTQPKPKKPELEAVEAKLKKLKAWKEQGLITEQEYQTKKADLLKGL